MSFASWKLLIYSTWIIGPKSLDQKWKQFLCLIKCINLTTLQHSCKNLTALAYKLLAHYLPQWLMTIKKKTKPQHLYCYFICLPKKKKRKSLPLGKWAIKNQLATNEYTIMQNNAILSSMLLNFSTSNAINQLSCFTLALKWKTVIQPKPFLACQ